MTAELPLKYAELPLALIDPSPTNPRRSYDPQEMEELESSIRQHGVMEPLLVRPVGERFEIVCGERRWRASKTAGLDTIPAITRTMDDVLMAELQMVENIARSNLDPLEEAYGVERLIDLGRTREQVATALHRSADWVQLRLDLGQLPAIALDAIRAKRLRLDTAEQMLRLTAAEREAAVQDILELGEDMTNIEVRELLRQRYIEPRARRAKWAVIAAKHAAAHPGADPIPDCELSHQHLRPWGDPVAPWVLASHRIGPAAANPAEESITWGELAIGHGIRLLMVPAGDINAGKIEILVDQKAVREAEAAARENGLPHTIGHRQGGNQSPAPADEAPAPAPDPSRHDITAGHDALPLIKALLDVFDWGWRSNSMPPVDYLLDYCSGDPDSEERKLDAELRSFFGLDLP